MFEHLLSTVEILKNKAKIYFGHKDFDCGVAILFTIVADN